MSIPGLTGSTRVYTISNSRGKFSAFVHQRSMLLVFRRPETAQSLAQSIESFYRESGHWPRIEFGENPPYLYTNTSSPPPQIVTVLEEAWDDVSWKCGDDYLDMLVIDELDGADFLTMKGSLVSRQWTAAEASQYLAEKLTASIDEM